MHGLESCPTLHYLQWLTVASAKRRVPCFHPSGEVGKKEEVGNMKTGTYNNSARIIYQGAVESIR